MKPQADTNRSKVAYEWETGVAHSSIISNITRLRSEIKRISETTLRGVFVNPDDKDYWVIKLKKMNSELSCLEQMLHDNAR